MASLSVIIPTYNEVYYVKDAIQSVSFADEIILIDSYSTDDTIAIAKEMGVTKIIQRHFDNFSNQKNEAIKHATSDWILFLDADERVTKKLEFEIVSTIDNPKHNAYKIKFPHFYMNRFLYYHTNSVTRLVKNSNIEFKGTVHEKLITDGSIGTLKNFMIHYTYKGLFHYLKKKDLYAWFQAENLLKKKKTVSYPILFFKPFYRFFHCYIIKRGFLDGVPGLAVAAINAYGVFSRYAKLILLKRGLK